MVTTLHPRTAFLDQTLATNFRTTSSAISSTGSRAAGVVKISLALSELPSFTADPSNGQAEHHTGSVEMAPTMEYIEAAFQDARTGRAALAPFSDAESSHDAGQDPEPDGTHIMSLFTQWVPARVGRCAAHRGTRGLHRPADRPLRRGGTGIQTPVMHRDIVRPHEMEVSTASSAATSSGELSLEQLFHMRPAPGFADYRTPIAGLYSGSSATRRRRVCGIPGWQAARAALADKEKASRRGLSSSPGAP